MYIPLAQAALNDVKGLLELHPNTQKEIIPLLDICGQIDKNIRDFCQKWPSENAFFVDVSPTGIEHTKIANQAGERHLIVDLGLDDPNNGFANRKSFYLDLQSTHDGIIPSISWEGVQASRRDVLRFALELLNDFEIIAIRICLWDERSDHQKNLDYTKAILDIADDQEKVWLLLDQGPLEHPNDLITSGKINDYLRLIDSTHLKGWAVISTSFPEQRPNSGSWRNRGSFDYAAQSSLSTTNTSSIRAYGDYASSALGSATGYILGMRIIPFASYLYNFEWWLSRKGSDKEYIKYVELASDMLNLPQFQGASFCWANENYDRISKLGSAAQKGYGNSGTWNGYRLNQHITEIVRCINTYGFPASRTTPPSEEEDS